MDDLEKALAIDPELPRCMDCGDWVKVCECDEKRKQFDEMRKRGKS